MNNQIATTNQTGIQVQQQQNPLVYPAIRTHPDNEIFRVVLQQLARSYTDLGLEQPSPSTMDYMANTLTDSIPKRFPSIRLHEISEAWGMGIRGKLGKFYGLSVVAFENFIQAYLDLESREKFARELPKIEEKTEPDDLVKFETAKFNALQALQRKITGADVSLLAVVVYRFLDGLKLIPFTSEEKTEFMKDAKEQLFIEYRDKAVAAKDSLERKSFKRKMDRMSVALLLDSFDTEPDEHQAIINRARKLALETFLADCIINDVNLEELIESKKDLFLEQCKK